MAYLLFTQTPVDRRIRSPKAWIQHANRMVLLAPVGDNLVAWQIPKRHAGRAIPGAVVDITRLGEIEGYKLDPPPATVAAPVGKLPRR